MACNWPRCWRASRRQRLRTGTPCFALDLPSRGWNDRCHTLSVGGPPVRAVGVTGGGAHTVGRGVVDRVGGGGRCGDRDALLERAWGVAALTVGVFVVPPWIQVVRSSSARPRSTVGVNVRRGSVGRDLRLGRIRGRDSGVHARRVEVGSRHDLVDATTDRSDGGMLA